jgi:predicted TIM-barrel fold metal-dependent hydrolase
MKAASMLLPGTKVESQPGFSSLISLASSKNIVIKFSAFSRASTLQETSFSDLEPIIKKFAIHVPDQLIWSSDWPHTGEAKGRKGRSLEVIEQFEKVDDVSILKNLRTWVDDITWRKIMVENPERMFD